MSVLDEDCLHGDALKACATAWPVLCLIGNVILG